MYSWILISCGTVCHKIIWKWWYVQSTWKVYIPAWVFMIFSFIKKPRLDLEFMYTSLFPYVLLLSLHGILPLLCQYLFLTWSWVWLFHYPSEVCICSHNHLIGEFLREEAVSLSLLIELEMKWVQRFGQVRKSG